MTYQSLEEAQSQLYRGCRTLSDETKEIEDTLGKTLAEDVIARVTQPPFRRSAMDGYALSFEDVKDISNDHPKTFPVMDCIYAGDRSRKTMSPGQAVRIMTGAPIPREANVIIPQEMTDYGEEQVTVYQSLPRHANCVPEGEDFRKGDVLAKKGQKVDAYTIATCVAAGVGQVRVKRGIRAAVITTGTELAAPKDTLQPGQIYNSNLAFFRHRLWEKGCDVVSVSQIGDDMQAITEAIIRAVEVDQADLILTTGGVSVGKHDYLPDIIHSLHGDILFQGISVKPGSPTMAARYGDTTILCLSGNPYSAIAMFEMLYPYYEQKAYDRKDCALFSMHLPSVNGYPKASKKRRILRGILTPEGIYLPKDQKNGQLMGGIGSNCLVDLAAGTPYVTPGDPVKVWMNV